MTLLRYCVLLPSGLAVFPVSFCMDLDPYDGKNPDCMFPLFYKQVARELEPKLAVIFMHLVNRGSFLTCWRLIDIVPLPKNSPS